MPFQLNESIQEHYARQDLGNRILGALAQAGKDLDRLRPEDLAAVDEFHVRGRAATLELARAASTSAAASAVLRAVSPRSLAAASPVST